MPILLYVLCIRVILWIASCQFRYDSFSRRTHALSLSHHTCTLYTFMFLSCCSLCLPMGAWDGNVERRIKSDLKMPFIRWDVEFSKFYCRISDVVCWWSKEHDTSRQGVTKRAAQRKRETERQCGLFVANVTLNSITQYNNAIANCVYIVAILYYVLRECVCCVVCICWVDRKQWSCHGRIYIHRRWDIGRTMPSFPTKWKAKTSALNTRLNAK